MKKLGWLCLSFASAACATPPPAQVPDKTTSVADAPAASGSAAPDMPGPGDGTFTAPAPPADAFQPVTGTLGGAPWELKGAGTMGPLQKDGTVLVGLANYPIACGEAHEAAPGDRTIVVAIPWKQGAKTELAKLKPADIKATEINAKNKSVSVKGWRPKGTIEVLGAPTRAKTSGRIKIELTSGKDSISAEVPVRFCFPN